MKMAILTGGGDCSGLNAAIRAVVKKASLNGDKVIGIRDGWKGLVEGRTIPLDEKNTANILASGGTILGSSRVNPMKVTDGIARCLQFFKKNRFDVLIAIGGEGTTQVAAALAKKGMPVICIPKTIDNDLAGTDTTIGFDTAVQVATDAIDRLQTTAESHHRVMIVEVMGRHAGWIAAYAGIAGGADAIIVPEETVEMKQLCRVVEKSTKRRGFSIFVVSEDARIRMENGKILKTSLHHDEYGDIKLGGISEMLAVELRKRTDSEVRVTILGHVQRGGTPTAFDRVVATRMGIFAVKQAHEKNFGCITVFSGNRIEAIPLFDSSKKRRPVDREILETIRSVTTR